VPTLQEWSDDERLEMYLAEIGPGEAPLDKTPLARSRP
jgi:hypothetical protein